MIVMIVTIVTIVTIVMIPGEGGREVQTCPEKILTWYEALEVRQQSPKMLNIYFPIHCTPNFQPFRFTFKLECCGLN